MRTTTEETEEEFCAGKEGNRDIGRRPFEPTRPIKPGYNENVVILCGNILQSILKDIWRRDNVPGDPETQNVQKLLNGAKGSIDDQLIKRYFDEATEVSLTADAGEHLKMEDAFEMLRKLSSVVMWYLTKYSYENLKRRVIPVRRIVALISLVFVFSVVSSSFVTHSFFSRSSGSKPTAPLAIAKTLFPQTTAPVNTQNDDQKPLTDMDWLRTGIKQGENKDWDGALHSFTQAIKMNKFYMAYAHRAAVHANKGLYEKALADCNEALKTDPDYGYAYYIRGTVFWLTNEIEKAKKDLIKGCSLGHSWACKEYRKLTGKKIPVPDENTETDIQVGEQNKEKNELTHKEWMNKGVEQANKRDWDGAICSFTHALSLHTNYNYYVLRGAAYVNEGFYKRALADCNESLIINPNYGYAYYIRGRAYEGLNEIDKARKDLMKGCSLRYSDACKSYEKLTGKKISVPDNKNK